MNRIISIILFVNIISAGTFADTNCASKLFTSSKSFDLIASLQYFDKIKAAPQFCHLSADSVFIRRLNHINDHVTASKLCNFYASFNGDKNVTDSCAKFFSQLAHNDDVAHSDADWIRNIASLQPDLAYCIAAINDAGYSEYWDTKIKPVLEQHINAYPISEETLNTIHDAITDLSGPELLPSTHSNIYILNIDNAFNLSNEAFCCTPILLDPELEKKFRLDFLKVYTHENLHRLSISDRLMQKLDELTADDFYRENENVAKAHNEGRNEAFVVAAEVYISHKIGRRNKKNVYDEFIEYVDGSLVLAPIIYSHLHKKRKDESLNDFILRLFDSGIISVGSVKAEYNKAMNQIASQ